MTAAPSSTVSIEQLPLPGSAELFAAVGLTDVPQGLDSMTARQRQFAIEFLKCGNTTEAARRAGYSTPESDGSKVKKNAVVAAFLDQAGRRLSKDADSVVKRAMDRSIWLHDELQLERAKPDGSRNWKREKQLHGLVHKADMLLAALVGKLQLNVKVGGEVTHNHTISDEQRQHLLELQKGMESWTPVRN